MRGFFVAAVAGLLAFPAQAEIVEVTLSEAVSGATAITLVDASTLLVAKPSGGYLCSFAIDVSFFPSIKDNMAEAAEYYRPSAVCVSVDVFKAFGDN